MQKTSELNSEDVAPMRTIELHQRIQEQYEHLLATSTKKAANKVLVRYSHSPGHNATFKWRWFVAFEQIPTDLLHQTDLGVFKHMLNWLIEELQENGAPYLLCPVCICVYL